MNINDNVVLNVEIKNLDDFAKLAQQFKDLKLNITNVASAARLMAEQQKASIREVMAAEEIAESQRDGRSERRRLNKITNLKVETQATLNEIRIQEAAELASQRVRALSSKNAANENVNNLRIQAEAERLQAAEINKKKAALSLANAETRAATTNTANYGNALNIVRGNLISMAAALGLDSLSEFSGRVFEAQSKIQALRLQLGQLLKDDLKADALFKNFKDFIQRTPFTFEDSLSSFEQLIGGFKGIGASAKTIQEQTIPILESLGNSAAALGGGDRLNRLVYAFTQVQSAGRLMGTEVRQIAETGFPLLAVMSEKSGESVSKLRDRISAGGVGFTEFRDAMLSAGQAGGVFFGIMDKQVSAVAGQFSNLKDKVFLSLANIGNYFEESAKKGISALSSFADFIAGSQDATERFVSIIKSIGSAFVAYYAAGTKATWITGIMTAATKLYNIALGNQTVVLTVNKAAQEAGLFALSVKTVATTRLTLAESLSTTATNLLTLAQERLNFAMKNNPIGLVITVLASLYAGVQMYKALITDTSDEQELFNKSQKSFVGISTELTAKLKSEQAEINSLIGGLDRANISTGERKRLIEMLVNKYPEYFRGISIEKVKTSELKAISDKLNGSYETRINLARIAFKTEQLAKSQKDLFEQQGNTIDEVNKKYGTNFKLAEQAIEFLNKLDNVSIKKNIGYFNYYSGTGKDAENGVRYVNQLSTINKQLKTIDEDNIFWNNQRKESEEATVKALVAAENVHYDVVKKQAKTQKEQQIALQAHVKRLREIKGEEEPLQNSVKGSGADKALKKTQYSAELINIIKKKAALDGMEQTRQIAEQSLKLEKEIEERKINESKGSATKKRQELLEIDNKYKEKLFELDAKWDKTERENAQKKQETLKKDIAKYDDEILKLEKNTTELIKEIQDEANLQSELDLAKTEQERIKILDKYAKIKFERKRKEILDEMSLNELKIEGIKVMEDATSLESQARIKELELRNKELYNNLLKLTQEYNKNKVDINKKSNDQIEKDEKESDKRRLQFKKENIESIIELTKTLVSNTLDSLDGFDAESTKKYKKQVTAIKKSVEEVTAAIKKIDLKQAITENGKTTFKDVNIFEGLDLSKGFGDGINKAMSNIKVGLGGAASADPLGFATSMVSTVNSIINAVADTATMLKQVKADKILASLKTDLAKIEAEYKKTVKIIEDAEKEQLAKSAENARVRTKEVIESEAAQISAIISSKEEVANINLRFNNKEAQIREQYKEALNSSNKEIAEAARIHVEGLIATAREGRNKELFDLYDSEQKKIAINKAADDEIAQIRINNADKTLSEQQALIDKVNEKRNADLEALKGTLSEEERIKKESADKINIINKEAAAQDYNIKASAAAKKAEAEKAYQDAVYKNELATFEANKKLSIAMLKIEKAKAIAKIFSLGIFGLPSLFTINPINDAIDELEKMTPPPPPFFKGTDNTSDFAKGKKRVDNKGGFRAILHPNEAVFSESDMNRMTRNGHRPSREEVINKVNFYDNVLYKLKDVRPSHFAQKELSNTIKLEKEIIGLRKDLNSLVKGFEPSKVVINGDMNGLSVYQMKKGVATRRLNSKFGG